MKAKIILYVLTIFVSLEIQASIGTAGQNPNFASLRTQFKNSKVPTTQDVNKIAQAFTCDGYSFAKNIEEHMQTKLILLKTNDGLMDTDPNGYRFILTSSGLEGVCTSGYPDHAFIRINSNGDLLIENGLPNDVAKNYQYNINPSISNPSQYSANAYWICK
jgi:hypothetical protein